MAEEWDVNAPMRCCGESSPENESQGGGRGRCGDLGGAACAETPDTPGAPSPSRAAAPAPTGRRHLVSGSRESRRF